MTSELVWVAIQEVALEGPDGAIATCHQGSTRHGSQSVSCAGCTVPQLWPLLQAKLPVSGIESLSPVIKQLLWAILLQRVPVDVQLMKVDAAPATNAAAAPSEEAQR